MKTICYLSFGYPSIEESLEMAGLYLKAGCDMIEVSIPARDPYVDPPFIADRMGDALQACGDYDAYLAGLGDFLDAHPDARVVLLIYEETMQEIGLDRLVAFCNGHGVKDLIYANFKTPAVKQALVAGGLRICSPVLRNMKEQDIQQAQQADGFVYMEAKTDKPTPPGFDTLADCIAHLRSIGITRPIYCGVGVHTPEDVKMVKAAGGDGFFIGSTLIRLYGEPEKLVDTIRAFKVASL